MEYLDQASLNSVINTLTNLETHIGQLRNALKNCLIEPNEQDVAAVTQQLITKQCHLHAHLNPNDGNPILAVDVETLLDNEGTGTLSTLAISPIWDDMTSEFILSLVEIYNRGYHDLDWEIDTDVEKFYLSLVESQPNEQPSEPDTNVVYVDASYDWVAKVTHDGEVNQRYNTKEIAEKVRNLHRPIDPVAFISEVHQIALHNPPQRNQPYYLSIPGLNPQIDEFTENAVKGIDEVIEQVETVRDNQS